MIWDKLFKSNEKDEFDKVFYGLYEVLHKRKFTMNWRDYDILEYAVDDNDLEVFKQYLNDLNYDLSPDSDCFDLFLIGLVHMGVLK